MDTDYKYAFFEKNSMKTKIEIPRTWGGYMLPQFVELRELSKKDREDYISDFIKVARSGFGSEMDALDILNHTLTPDFLVGAIFVYSDSVELEGKLVGFGSFNLFEVEDHRILYRNGNVVHSKLQKKGIGTAIQKYAIQEFKPTHICSRTQNPNIYATMKKDCRELFPNEERTLDPDIVKIVAVLEEKLNIKVNRETFIARGLYGHSLYGINPRHNEYSDLFDKLNLSQEQGDAILLVGRI